MLKNHGGNNLTSLKDLPNLGCTHFSGLFKSPQGAPIAEVLWISILFPGFSYEVDNEHVMEVVSNE